MNHHNKRDHRSRSVGSIVFLVIFGILVNSISVYFYPQLAQVTYQNIQQIGKKATSFVSIELGIEQSR